MSHPVIEITAAITVVAALAFGATVLPRQKPAPTDKQTVQTEPRKVVPPKTITVEPQPSKSDAQRIDDVSKKADAVAAEQRQLVEQVKQLTAEVKGKNE